MTVITLQSTVADIVTAVPKTSDLFRELRIDFCCGGKIPLEQAAAERALNPDMVLKRVAAVAEKEVVYAEQQPASLETDDLIRYVQEKHHSFLREELPGLTPYVTKVANVHGDRHPHLLRVQELYRALKQELLEHTEDEDQHVFPLIQSFMEKPTAETAEKVKPHVMELEEEHEAAGAILKELRELTNGFNPPLDACGTYRLVYARLAKLEEDTFAHIHLENNVLFDRVRAAALA